MGHYTYDGTFYGLLTTIARILEWNDTPVAIQPIAANTADLFAEPTRVETVEIIAEDLLFQIRNEISELAYDHVLYTFLSEHKKRELILYYYIRKGLTVGAKVDHMLTDRWVAQTRSLTRKVKREVHRFKGFVRFSALADGSYFATIEPDYYILPLIAPHFVKCLADQCWIIHDIRRNKAAIYNRKAICLSDVSLSEELLYSQADDEHKRLWKQYYDAIGIVQRRNAKLRRQFIPLKYQKHLAELQK
ncbi:TIGR03915 family putative DNA repair protein [candidate division KSB1 bacterium]|nr:TIGR03915 family putative DNA repair protein [candidate division KSB1 bacterium]